MLEQPFRTSCERCRLHKLKCQSRVLDSVACDRCTRAGAACVFGRRRKAGRTRHVRDSVIKVTDSEVASRSSLSLDRDDTATQFSNPWPSPDLTIKAPSSSSMERFLSSGSISIDGQSASSFDSRQIDPSNISPGSLVWDQEGHACQNPPRFEPPKADLTWLTPDIDFGVSPNNYSNFLDKTTAPSIPILATSPVKMSLERVTTTPAPVAATEMQLMKFADELLQQLLQLDESLSRWQGLPAVSELPVDTVLRLSKHFREMVKSIARSPCGSLLPSESLRYTTDELLNTTINDPVSMLLIVIIYTWLARMFKTLLKFFRVYLETDALIPQEGDLYGKSCRLLEGLRELEEELNQKYPRLQDKSMALLPMLAYDTVARSEEAAYEGCCLASHVQAVKQLLRRKVGL